MPSPEKPSTQPAPMDQLSGEQMIKDDLLKQGLNQLVASAANLAKGDQPGAIKQHLHDLMSDTDGSFPQTERMAAYELLATEQRAEIDKGLVISGSKMLEDLSSVNRQTDEELNQERSSLTCAIRATVSVHHAEMGRVLRGPDYNPRRVESAHGQVTNTSGEITAGADRYMKVIDGWAQQQGAEEQRFMGDAQQAIAHKTALEEGSKVVDREYDGEPKDLALLVDDVVLEATAAKIERALGADTEGDGSPADMLLKTLTDGEDLRTVQIIKSLINFSQANGMDSKRLAARSRTQFDSIRVVLSTFANRGRDTYSSIRNTDEAQNFSRQQGNELARVGDGAQSTLYSNSQSMMSAQEGIQNLQRQISAVTQ